MISPILELMWLHGEVESEPTVIAPKTTPAQRKANKNRLAHLKSLPTLEYPEFIELSKLRGGNTHIAKRIGLAVNTVYQMRQHFMIYDYWKRYNKC